MGLLAALLFGGLLLDGRAVGLVFGIGLEQLQVLVVEERRRLAIDLEPVGTNEILLVEHRVVGTHELEVSHLVETAKKKKRTNKQTNTFQNSKVDSSQKLEAPL